MFDSILRRLALLALLVALASPASATPLGSAFTYQGDLEQSGAPVTGNYDFIFALYNVASGGSPVVTAQIFPFVAVSRGLFTATMDFGAGVFDGSALWLDIMVRPAGNGSFTPLTPRQPITPAPYALRAINGPTGSSQWTNDTNGIDYTGHVGIGGPSNSWAHLDVTTDPSVAETPVYIHTSNPGYAALYFANTGGGTGLYDSASGSHYLQGRLGIGGLATNGKVEVTGAGNGIWCTTGGTSFNPHYNAAIVALGTNGPVGTGAPAMGVYAGSSDERGVWGVSGTGYGVAGNCTQSGNYAVLGSPTEGLGAWSANVAWPAGRFNAPTGGVAIEANGLAKVKTLQILGGADLAERFDVVGQPEPGTVLRIDESRTGALRVCDEAYSARVAGVVSGANDLAAGIELGKGEAGAHTVAVALTGRVWVKCDASAGAIHAGDLLTTAARAGYAMRVADRDRAQGAILGKAMTSLETGSGLVLVLVSLQ